MNVSMKLRSIVFVMFLVGLIACGGSSPATETLDILQQGPTPVEGTAASSRLTETPGILPQEPTLVEGTAAPSRPAETITIFSPGHMQEVSGGELQVSGYSEYFFEASLSLALCGEGGSGAPHTVCGTVDNVLAEGATMIDSPDMGQPGPFQGSLSYQVSRQVRARLVVYSISPRDGSIEHASSVLVVLDP
jgi:hypothetical protein